MQISNEDLDAAVSAGIIDARARERILAFAAARAAGNAGPDNESFRFLTGFNDIFVTLACLLVLVAVGSLSSPLIAGFAVAAAAWGLAEYFTRIRRMALPSIVLLLAFVGSLFGGVMAATGAAEQFAAMNEGGRMPLGAIMASGAVAAAGALAHWFRFRVPITMAAGALSVVALVGAMVAKVSTHSSILLATMLLAGLVIFALAMRYDMADRERLTRNTDIAFWLHLLAAPLIVHPIFALTGITGGNPTPLSALAVISVYAVLTLVALAVDRRALLVSALAYVLWTLNHLFQAGEVAAGFGLTALILGGFLIMLSAAWGHLRHRLLAALPEQLRNRLPAAPLLAQA